MEARWRFRADGARPGRGAREWREAFDAIEAAAGAAEEGVLAAEEQRSRRAPISCAHARLEAARATRSLRTSRSRCRSRRRRAREVTIELTYRTPCALWRPEHLARWTPPGDGEPSTVTITTAAVIWQATGEVWSNVTARFSTARPAQSAAPPLLTDDVLTTRRKSDPERSRVVVEAREQAIATAGLARGTRDVDEMPGVEDGGEAQWFEGAHPVTIPSDGEAHRVELTRASMTAEVERIAWPERGDAVHLRATATLVGEAPLLAGLVVLARGASWWAGARGFVGRGEPFELGFGTDDGLRVRRTVDEKRDTTPVIGTQKVARTVRVYLSNLSDEARRLTVIERYPVSEVDEVKVAVVSHEDATLDARDGFAKWVVTLDAGGTRVLTLGYRIEAAAKVVLAGVIIGVLLLARGLAHYGLVGVRPRRPDRGRCTPAGRRSRRHPTSGAREAGVHRGEREGRVDGDASVDRGSSSADCTRRGRSCVGQPSRASARWRSDAPGNGRADGVAGTSAARRAERSSGTRARLKAGRDARGEGTLRASLVPRETTDEHRRGAGG